MILPRPTSSAIKVTGKRRQKLIRSPERLRKNTTNRPKKKKTLLSHLKANLGKEASEADVTGLLEKLIKFGHIKIDDKEGVSYHL